jgi:hypothetical protein
LVKWSVEACPLPAPSLFDVVRCSYSRLPIPLKTGGYWVHTHLHERCPTFHSAVEVANSIVRGMRMANLQLLLNLAREMLVLVILGQVSKVPDPELHRTKTGELGPLLEAVQSDQHARVSGSHLVAAMRRSTMFGMFSAHTSLVQGSSHESVSRSAQVVLS